MAPGIWVRTSEVRCVRLGLVANQTSLRFAAAKPLSPIFRQKMLTDVLDVSVETTGFGQVGPDGTVAGRPIIDDTYRCVWLGKRGSEEDTVVERPAKTLDLLTFPEVTPGPGLSLHRRGC